MAELWRSGSRKKQCVSFLWSTVSQPHEVPLSWSISLIRPRAFQHLHPTERNIRLRIEPGTTGAGRATWGNCHMGITRSHSIRDSHNAAERGKPGRRVGSWRKAPGWRERGERERERERGERGEEWEREGEEREREREREGEREREMEEGRGFCNSRPSPHYPIAGFITHRNNSWVHTMALRIKTHTWHTGNLCKARRMVRRSPQHFLTSRMTMTHVKIQASLPFSPELHMNQPERRTLQSIRVKEFKQTL